MYSFPTTIPVTFRGSEGQCDFLSKDSVERIPPLLGMDILYEQEINLFALNH